MALVGLRVLLDGKEILQTSVDEEKLKKVGAMVRATIPGGVGDTKQLEKRIKVTDPKGASLRFFLGSSVGNVVDIELQPARKRK